MFPGSMVKFVGMVVFCAMLVGCGSSTTPTPAPVAPGTSPTTGNLITIVHDVPVCNAITAAVVVEDMNFTNSSSSQGGTVTPYLNTTPSFAPEIRLNLTQLRDFDTILYTNPMKAGSYNQANLQFLIAQVTAFDPALTPPQLILPPSFTNSKPIIAINPPLVITAGQANVIEMDFDVQRMLETDSAGNITGSVTPVVNITQLSAITPTGAVNPNGFGEIDDLWGFVRSISNTNTTSNSNYIGNFQLQVLSPSVADAPEIPINLTSTTNKAGFADLGHLLPNSYVEADVNIDSSGNFVGNTVEVQAVENPYPTQVGVTPSTALIGPIISIQQDAAGNPTQLNLWAQEEEPDDIGTIPNDTIFQVDLTNGPSYQASVLGPNFANLTFGAPNLVVGQQLVVHGAYTKPPTTTPGAPSTIPFTVEPSAIFLKLQSMQGTLNSMLQIGSDDHTGVFVFSPCCTLLQGVPIYVVTNGQTNYLNVTGLAGITSVTSLVVKGMPYYEPSAVTINGVNIPAGSMVMQAKQVHVLQ
jgi:hypothetical protein